MGKASQRKKEFQLLVKSLLAAVTVDIFIQVAERLFAMMLRVQLLDEDTVGSRGNVRETAEYWWRWWLQDWDGNRARVTFRIFSPNVEFYDHRSSGAYLRSTNPVEGLNNAETQLHAKDTTLEGYRQQVAQNRAQKRGEIAHAMSGSRIPQPRKRKRQDSQQTHANQGNSQDDEKYVQRALQDGTDYIDKNSKKRTRFNTRQYTFPAKHWLFLQKHFLLLLGNLPIWLHVSEFTPSESIASGSTRLQAQHSGRRALQTLEETAPVVLQPFSQTVSSQGSTQLRGNLGDTLSFAFNKFNFYTLLTSDSFKTHILCLNTITSIVAGDHALIFVGM